MTELTLQDCRVILSLTDGGIVVGWDTCGHCHKLIGTCACKDGPAIPSYVKKWRPVVDEPKRVADTVTEGDQPTDTKPVALTMRKARSDKGKPRGPRKKPTAEEIQAVKEAAGDLGTAMKENINA